MPRDNAGNYTLPAGNPVITGTTITSDWANNTMSDVGNEITNSLSRNGNGGMLAPLPFVDGAPLTPSITFTLEPSLGFYRTSESIMALSGLGLDAFIFDTIERNITVLGAVPLLPTDLTRKDYVDGQRNGTYPLPTSDPVVPGALWNNAGIVNVSAG